MTEIFRTVFEDPALEITDDTCAEDVPGWNSLTHVSLIIEVERAFGVSFSAREVLGLKRHLDLETLVRTKLGEAAG